MIFKLLQVIYFVIKISVTQLFMHVTQAVLCACEQTGPTCSCGDVWRLPLRAHVVSQRGRQGDLVRFFAKCRTNRKLDNYLFLKHLSFIGRQFRSNVANGLLEVFFSHLPLRASKQQHFFMFSIHRMIYDKFVLCQFVIQIYKN